MSLLVWPHRLLIPHDQGWSIGGASIEGGRPLGGRTSNRTVFGGGGVFVARLIDVNLRSREQINAWHALEALLDNGASAIVIPRCDRRHGPIPPATVGRPTPHSDGTYFSDGTGYLDGAVASSVVGAAAFRATQLVLQIAGGRPLIGGEHFSIEHPTAGPRIYRVAQVLDIATAGEVTTYTLTIRVPLREAVAAGTEVEWKTPRCLMTLTDSDGMALDVELLKRGKASVSFIEDFTYVDGFAP